MPENTETPTSDDLVFVPDFQFIPGRHIYRQQGYYLICNSCVLQHAVFIGDKYLMVGEDENGTPILKKR